MTTAAVIIPYRDRGLDPLRKANLDAVRLHWRHFRWPIIVADDGRSGDAQFNRSAAYNRGMAQTDADILIFAESDMLIDFDQVMMAMVGASTQPGLVIPFNRYLYLKPNDSQRVRDGKLSPEQASVDWMMDEGRAVGAINVLSRKTIDAIGQWDESFEGSWYDDRAMHRAFDIAAGPTRWIPGPAYHLWHQPGWTGKHLTKADRTATSRNKMRYSMYLNADSPEMIRALTKGVLR